MSDDVPQPFEHDPPVSHGADGLDDCPPDNNNDDPQAAQSKETASNWSTGGYDRGVIDSVWQFAEIVAGNDPALWRKDEFGAWINRLDYGHRHSQFGWEICDVARSRATTGLSALRPMQWQNYLDQVAAMTQSRITADGTRNVRRLL
jgi:hypothetical protein